MQRRRLGAAIMRRQPDQDIVWRGFSIFDKNVKITVLVKNPRIEQLVFKFMSGASPIRPDEIVIREG
jgi:hypothetical protein